jgi:ankyrin repeat protein
MALSEKWFNYLNGNEHVVDGKIVKKYGFLDRFPLTMLEGKLILCSTPKPDVHLFNAYESYLDFIMVNRSIAITDRHFYEIIPGTFLQKPHFDIDFKIVDGYFKTLRPDGTEILYTPAQIIEHLIEAIIKVLDEVHINIDIETDILIYSSSLGEKQSYHLIINNWYHKSNLEAIGFYHLVVSKIPTELNTGKIIDSSVYSKTQQFRMLESTKVGTFRPKTLVRTFNYKGVAITHKYPDLTNYDQDQAEKQLYILQFEESLITVISNCNALPDFHKPEAIVKTTTTTTLDFQITPSIATYALSQLPSKASYKITKIKDGLVILQRTRPSMCELCKRIHTSENPFLRINNTGWIIYYCRRNGGSLPIGALPMEFLNNLKNANLQTLENTINTGLGVHHHDPNLGDYGIPNLHEPQQVIEHKVEIWEKNIDVKDLTSLDINVFVEPNVININKAVESGKLDLVKLLCKKVKPSENTLNIASRKGHLEIVQFLWNLGLRPSEETLELASANGNLEVLKFFVSSNIPPTQDLMSLASANGHLHIITYLISIGIKPTIVTLNRAVENGHLSLVQFLCDLGIKPTVNTLDQGIENGHYEIIKYLLSLGIKPKDASIIKAKKCGNPAIIELIK